MNKEILSKENFWDEMEQKYPKAIKYFKEWVDWYKAHNDWNMLFNYKGEFFDWVDPDNHSKGGTRRIAVAPKCHELPIAMQFGIFIEFIANVIEVKALTANNPRKTIEYHLKKLETNYKDYDHR